jgi:hypothetical protein
MNSSRCPDVVGLVGEARVLYHAYEVRRVKGERWRSEDWKAEGLIEFLMIRCCLQNRDQERIKRERKIEEW